MTTAARVTSYPYQERDRSPIMSYPMPWQAPRLEEVAELMGLNQPSAMRGPRAMYMHIPFCEYLCSFCPFVKYLKDEEKVKIYLDALKAELHFYASTPYFKSATFGSLYMGGGTASCLSSEQLVEVLTLCKQIFRFEPDAEITLESNPKTIDLEKLQAVRGAGVNCVSFGVQTFDDTVGSQADVAQTGLTSKQAVQTAMQAGINYVSIDLIYNLPGQTFEIVQRDLEVAMDLGIRHITLFPLSVMPHTRLFRLVKDKQVSEIGDLAHELSLSTQAGEFLRSKGYMQNSIPDFALPGTLYRHAHIHFRQLEDLLGVGAGAMGSVNKYNYVNVAELSRYSEVNAGGLPPINAGQQTPLEEKPRSAMCINLRLLSVDKADFRRRFGHDPEYYFAELLERLQNQGLLEIDEHEVRLTELGILFGYNVAKEFYSDEIRAHGQKLAEALARKRDVISVE